VGVHRTMCKHNIQTAAGNTDPHTYTKKKSRIGDKLDLTPLPERIWNEVIPSSFTRDRLRQTGKWYIIGLRGGEFVRVVNGNRFS